MMTRKLVCCVSIVCALSGCASAYVNRGAAIGTLSGAAAGAGVGFLISNEDLLGSPSGGPSGDNALPTTGSILGGLAIGAVFGAIVGAMAGHGRDDGFEPPEPVQELPPPPTAETSQESAEVAPYLRNL